MNTAMQSCYRHNDRRAGVSCQRCNRPICPSCMHQASVGFQCPECASSGKQKVYDRTNWSQASQPIVTQVLIGVNVAVFVVGLLLANGGRLSGVGGDLAIDYGLLGQGWTGRSGGFELIGVAEGQWWRLLTGGFLHGGALHLAFNMFALWTLGRQLEPALGRVPFAVVYVTSLLAGSLGVMVLDPDALTVGASGAIFGLFGVALASQVSQKVNVWDTGLGGVLLINLLFTFGIPGISIGGHLGGLAGGFLCGTVLYRLTPKQRSTVLPTVLCAALGVACFVGAIVAATVQAS